MNANNSNGSGGSGANGSSGNGSGPSASSRRKQRRRSQNRSRAVDLWRPVPQLPDPDPIVAATDPGIVLRSLGQPPLQGVGSQAEHAFELVVRRSSMMATALAATAGLLAQPDDDA